MFEYQYAILGSLLNYPYLFDVCILNKDYFADKLKPLFSAMQMLYVEDKKIILEKLFTKKEINADDAIYCQDYGLYSDIESFNKLQELAIDQYKKNQIAFITNDLATGVIDIEQYDFAYRKITDNKLSKPQYLTTEELLDSCTSAKQKIKFNNFKVLERKLNLVEQDFMILAAKTGVGKTGTALNLLCDLANTYPCMYFNMEMSSANINQRLVGLTSKVQIKELPDLKVLSQEKKNNVYNAINSIAQRKIEIVNETQSIEQIRNKIASRKHDKHSIVFIDHIGLIKYSKAKSAYERVTEIAKELRRICLDYDCTIIALCQLNRVDKNEKKPSLTMLRDSGELEQSARKVMFVWATEIDNPTKSDEKMMYELVIEKNDSGDRGIVPIDYYKKTQIIKEK